MDNLQLLRYVTELERRLDNLACPEQAYHYQMIPVVKAWAPSTDEASDTLVLTAAPWSLPAGIKAVSCFLAYQAANADDFGALEMELNDGEAVHARVPDAGETGTGSGIVTCDSDGSIYFRTTNATNTVYLYIHGYFI